MTPLLVLAAVPGVSPSPTPSPAGPLDPTTVSPGLTGFLVTFGLAVAIWFLARSLVRHLRRLNHRPGPEGRAPGSTPQITFPPIDPEGGRGHGDDDPGTTPPGEDGDDGGPGDSGTPGNR